MLHCCFVCVFVYFAHFVVNWACILIVHNSHIPKEMHVIYYYFLHVKVLYNVYTTTAGFVNYERNVLKDPSICDP